VRACDSRLQHSETAGQSRTFEELIGHAYHKRVRSAGALIGPTYRIFGNSALTCGFDVVQATTMIASLLFAGLIAFELLALLVLFWCGSQSLSDWLHHRPPYDWPPPRPRRPGRVRHFEYWPWRIVQRYRQRRLTLHRGYSTSVLAEFDTRFNGMACDAMRYHLSVDGAAGNEDERRVFEHLIRRLGERPPGPTPNEKTAIDTWAAISGSYVYVTGGGYQYFERHHLRREARWALESWESRQDEWRKRNDDARHAFVDVMRKLRS
jgi:hypothetical protein